MPKHTSLNALRGLASRRAAARVGAKEAARELVGATRRPRRGSGPRKNRREPPAPRSHKEPSAPTLSKMDEPELNIDEKAQRQYELVEALVGRMQRISAKSTERLQGCRDDRDCWTEKCSHDISTIEDDIRAEMGRTKKRHKSKFLPSDGGSPTVTWRHARETDKGKQLEETINEEWGTLFADAGTKKWRRRL